MQVLDDALASLTGLDALEAQWIGKDLLARLADVAQVAFLYALDAGQGGRYGKLAALYAARFLRHEPYPAWAMNDPDVLAVAPAPA
jgi:hypothetical protein